MSLSKLQELAAWHRLQAEIHERDANLCAPADVDALCRSRNLSYFHANAARHLNDLAQAFTVFFPQSNESSE